MGGNSRKTLRCYQCHPDTFRLATYDANGTADAVAQSGGNDNDATVTFTKVEKALRMYKLWIEMRTSKVLSYII